MNIQESQETWERVDYFFLILLCHFHLSHKQLGISWPITTDSSILDRANR